ncbi:hypothetical protein C0J52_06743 [Blattella germanica]|nr:hypothetical protein C0J52_06743 [Blattella germanica]PSN43031.1 hypothetical protein C0J52_06743 [Blattella germanica]
MKSTRKRSAELDIPRSTMQDHMRKDLHISCFRPSSVSELEQGVHACEILLTRFPHANDRKNVMFSDECAIYRSSRNCNVYFWAKDNPHYYEEIECNPPHFMIRAGMTSDHLLGPYFVNQHSYLHMINMWLLPELTARGIADIVTLQQDGAPPHFAVSVRTRLNELFPNRWNGCGSRDLPAPLPWPPRSPDLTTTDNALWGVIKEEVRKQ